MDEKTRKGHRENEFLQEVRPRYDKRHPVFGMTETDMAAEPWRGLPLTEAELFGLHGETDEEAEQQAMFWRKANRNTIIGVVIFVMLLAACGAGVATWVA
jgi:hypothetical protein